MNSTTHKTENVNLSKEGQGAASTPTPATFNAEAMSKVLVNAYMNIAAASAKARPLKDAWVKEMQKTAGYEPAEGVTMLKDVSGTLSGVTHDGTFFNVKAALAAGHLKPLETKPSQALVDAMSKVDGAVKDFNTTLADATRPLLVAMPSKSKNPNMPSGTRTASKGFVTAEEWATVSAEERAQYNMSFDGTAITLDDVNGEKHVCRSIKALKRHEAGEGHK